MRVLLDTNVLLRLSQPAHPHHAAVLSALRTLSAAAADLCISSQTVYEFLAVATRPVAASGLGMDQVAADAEVGKLVVGLTMLYDSPAVLGTLRRLVVTHRVTGKSVHDARLVAAMLANGVTHLLTINSVDFNRYPGITVIDPRVSP